MCRHRHDSLRRFAVQFSMSICRTLSIGVYAGSSDDAELAVRKGLSEGSIWNNTDLMPILDDYFEEQTDGALEFVTEAVNGQFVRSPSAMDLIVSEKRIRACEALVAAYRYAGESGDSVQWEDVDEAYRLALEGLVISE